MAEQRSQSGPTKACPGRRDCQPPARMRGREGTHRGCVRSHRRRGPRAAVNAEPPAQTGWSCEDGCSVRSRYQRPLLEGHLVWGGRGGGKGVPGWFAVLCQLEEEGGQGEQHGLWWVHLPSSSHGSGQCFGAVLSVSAGVLGQCEII